MSVHWMPAMPACRLPAILRQGDVEDGHVDDHHEQPERHAQKHEPRIGKDVGVRPVHERFGAGPIFRRRKGMRVSYCKGADHSPRAAHSLLIATATPNAWK